VFSKELDRRHAAAAAPAGAGGGAQRAISVAAEPGISHTVGRCGLPVSQPTRVESACAISS
jgi:hypothetical protein